MNDIKVMNHAADNIRILAASMVEKANILFMFAHRNHCEKTNMNMMKQLLLLLAMGSVWEHKKEIGRAHV